MRPPSLLLGVAASAVGLLLATRAGADPSASGPFPAPSSLGWSSAVWGDGDDLLVVASGRGVSRICRGGSTASGPTFSGAFAVAGTGKGAGATLVAGGARGQLARWSAGKWETVSAPLLGQDDLKGVAVDARGRVLAAGAGGALYVWDHDTWQVHRYPAGAKVAGLVVGPDGAAYLFGTQGRVWVFQNDALRPLLIDSTPPLGGDVVAAWMSPSTGLLWAATDQGVVVSIEVARGQARAIKSPLFGAPRALTGISSPAGDLVAVSGQSDLAIYDGTAWKTLGVNISFPEGLLFDARGASLYAVNRDGLQRVPVDHPRLAAAQAALPAAPTGDAACPPDAASTPVTTPAPLAKPSAIPPSTGLEEPRTLDVMRWPTLRAAAGYGFHPGEPGGITSSFDLDINLGFRAGITRSFALWPELGYSYITNGKAGGNFVTAGVGPIFGTPIIAVGWLPKLVVGDARGDFGVGMRNSLVGSFIYDIVSVEVSHQWVHTGPADHHEGRVMFGFDVLPVAGYLLFTNLMYSIFPRTPRP